MSFTYNPQRTQSEMVNTNAASHMANLNTNVSNVRGIGNDIQEQYNVNAPVAEGSEKDLQFKSAKAQADASIHASDIQMQIQDSRFNQARLKLDDDAKNKIIELTKQINSGEAEKNTNAALKKISDAQNKLELKKQELNYQKNLMDANMKHNTAINVIKKKLSVVDLKANKDTPKYKIQQASISSNLESFKASPTKFIDSQIEQFRKSKNGLNLSTGDRALIHSLFVRRVGTADNEVLRQFMQDPQSGFKDLMSDMGYEQDFDLMSMITHGNWGQRMTFDPKKTNIKKVEGRK